MQQAASMHTLLLPVSVNSKFDVRLLQQHIMQANFYVEHCKTATKQVLDVCGESGDFEQQSTNIKEPAHIRWIADPYHHLRGVCSVFGA